MQNSMQQLKQFKNEHEFFIGIDSDGCVFDTMEIKHKECFCPQFINHFELQAVSRYAREAWEFINLYSKTRGVNRFKAVIETLQILSEREEIIDRKIKIPSLDGVRQWINRETKLGNPALKKEIEQTDDPDLKRALAWSEEVNQVITKMVHHIPPFPFVNHCLEKMKSKADIMVVSQTPCEALQREWREHQIDSYVQVIAGQEMGTKKEHIKLAADNRYPGNKMLMIGDAPGDYRAAMANHALFYPILPGNEDYSWKRLYAEALDKFYLGQYAGEYEERLLAEFNQTLPENPPWKG